VVSGGNLAGLVAHFNFQYYFGLLGLVNLNLCFGAFTFSGNFIPLLAMSNSFIVSAEMPALRAVGVWKNRLCAELL
jgi:hypothetical protein